MSAKLYGGTAAQSDTDQVKPLVATSRGGNIIGYFYTTEKRRERGRKYFAMQVCYCRGNKIRAKEHAIVVGREARAAMDAKEEERSTHIVLMRDGTQFSTYEGLAALFFLGRCTWLTQSLNNLSHLETG